MNDTPIRKPTTPEEALDEALTESFPASDPPAPARPHRHSAAEEEARRKGCDYKADVSETLDEALDETFPASDPPAIVQPHKPHENEDDAVACEIPRQREG